MILSCSPFLKIGITSATYNESRYTSSFRQKLKRSLTNLNIKGLAKLINLVSMSDVLVAFFIFNFAISLYTSCGLHGDRNIDLLALFDDQT